MLASKTDPLANRACMAWRHVIVLICEPGPAYEQKQSCTLSTNQTNSAFTPLNFCSRLSHRQVIPYKGISPLASHHDLSS